MAAQMNYEAIIEKAFKDSEKNASALANNPDVAKALASCAQSIVEAYKKGGCLFVAGNGGSAADAQHLVAELVSKLFKDRTPIRAFAMTVDTSILTAVGNDYGYEFVFDRQVRGLMKSNDIFLGITTSGNSKNIVKAFQACREVGCRSILLSGGKGGECLPLADQAILVPSSLTPHIQESHLVVYHTLCYLIEVGLIESGLCKYV
jgi:D-sedoheptulose 7-phosphate isomerase